MANTDRHVIFKGGARIADEAAIQKLLAPVPRSSEIRPLLTRGSLIQRYDSDAQRDYWLASDGRVVLCVAIAGIGISDAGQIRLSYEKLESPTFSAELIMKLVTRVTGAEVWLVT